MMPGYPTLAHGNTLSELARNAAVEALIPALHTEEATAESLPNHSVDPNIENLPSGAL